ncbi:MAG: hypothetical protein KGD63_10160 [Candidatus Lokiarchaeota archaeon]|nr:hypothetical protein [Candidatus Lokiarchaeota archaeon]
MSKFDRHIKKSATNIFPHKHCKECEDLIEDSYTYCSECYIKVSERKTRKGFIRRIFSRKKNKI